MESYEIGVLIVDDSALMRNIIAKIVDNTPGLVVAGRAMNGQFALDKIPVCKPDVIVLDIEMPVMDGLEFLKERKKRGIDIPVIMLSSLTTENAAVTMQCIELGASDFLPKPNASSQDGNLGAVAARLAELLPSYGGRYAKQKGNKCIPLYRPPIEGTPVVPTPIFSFQEENSKTPSVITPIREPGKIDIIAIGISTGGPNALREVFKKIDPNIKQPILVVQHMPAGFTKEFANSLNSLCPLEVKEAQDGDIIKPGRILIAPGNFHIYVEKRSLANIVRLSDGPQRNGHRPSVDVLFESISAIYQNHALGVIMTGMGNDGAEQLAEMRKQGAHTIGQDERSCIVYGMPRVAWEKGGVQHQVSLQNMANTINSLAKEYS